MRPEGESAHIQRGFRGGVGSLVIGVRSRAIPPGRGLPVDCQRDFAKSPNIGLLIGDVCSVSEDNECPLEEPATSLLDMLSFCPFEACKASTFTIEFVDRGKLTLMRLGSSGAYE